ncbi:MAG: 30S ribosome-binding factor RbfA [Thermodesulfobacteriota bacterium]|nr:MAG: 30S ribosome-binding factor RbfA [Thermodesulfobacteriota bacterium]
MSYKRSERVADLIKEEVASMVLYGEIKDPRIGFVTITKVELTPDLKEARIFFSQLGSPGDREKSRKGLESASGYIRRNLAKKLDLRHIPKITFLFDESLEYSEKIEKMIRDMKKEGDL